jgi:uncharacterized protein (DUF1778 family)
MTKPRGNKMPTKQNNITIYLTPEDEILVEKASKELALHKSAFCRTFAVQKAKQILNKNGGESKE